jgi:gluconate:H+ symporter, GntP family
MNLSIAFAATAQTDWWPLVVLGISLAFIVLAITKLRVPVFLALVMAAMLTGGLSNTRLPGEYGTLPKTPAKERGHWVRAAELTAEGFGTMASKIGIVVALAAIIGVCLVESGAAEKVVRRSLALLGENRAGHALFVSGYVLSIPIFFETYFMLLMPIAQALHVRTGRNYMAFVLAICCGGTITHSLVAPHPGPLIMAENLHLDVGQTIVAGILAGILPAVCAWMLAQRIAGKVAAPLRDSAGIKVADLKAATERPESELPSLGAALLPILLPLGLIGAVSFLSIFHIHSEWMAFFGERHVALLLGAIAGIALVMKQRGMSMAKVNTLLGPQFATAGVIILVSCAGGAFGGMLKHAGVATVVESMASRWDLNLVFLGWLISAIIRVAQGSATVAMMTASAIMFPIMSSGTLPYHPMYIFLSIGFGSKMISWMNDSGFWTVSKISGFTENETLKSWTILVTVGSLVGLVQCLVLSK